MAKDFAEQAIEQFKELFVRSAPLEGFTGQEEIISLDPRTGLFHRVDLSTITIGIDQTTRNGSVEVVWIEDLDFEVLSGDFYVAGTKYRLNGGLVTLNTGDATHPRFDVIVANIDGSPGVVEGSPAADPAFPEVDPDTQLALKPILVAALATTPSDVANEAVYEENTEWTTAKNDPADVIDLAATVNPYTGSVHIQFDGAPSGSYVTFTDGVTHAVEDL